MSNQPPAGPPAPPPPPEGGVPAPPPGPSQPQPFNSEAASAVVDGVKALANPANLKLLGFQALAFLAVGVLLALCFIGSASGLLEELGADDYGFDVSSQMHSFKAFLLMTGLVLGGGLRFAASGSMDADYGNIKVALSLVSITALLAAAGLNYFVVKKASAGVRLKSWGQAALQAGLHAVVLGLVFALFSLFGTIDLLSSDMFSAKLSARFGGVLLFVGLLVFISHLAAAGPRVNLRPSAWTAALREAVWLTVLVILAFGAIALVASIILMVRSDAPVSAYFLLVPLLGTLGVWGSSLGFFGALVPGGSGGGSMIMGEMGMLPSNAALHIWDFAEGKGAWLFAATVLVIVFAAIFLGARRQRTAAFTPARIWQLPLLSLGIWLVLALLTTVRFKLSADVMEFSGLRGTGTFGLSWYSVLFLALGTALVSVLAEFLPTLAYRISPAFFAAVAGKKSAAAWLNGTTAAASVPPAAPAAPGASPAASAPAAPAAAPAEITPMSAASKKKLKAAGFSLLGLVVLLGLGFGTVAYLNSQRKPEAEVQAYLDLLADGKAKKANEMVDPGVDNASRALLVDDVLGAAKQRLVVESVELEDKSDSSARVYAAYSINGERHEYTFSVDRGKKEYGLLDTWKLNDSLLVPVHLSADRAQKVLIGKTEIPLQESGGGFFSSEGYAGDFYAYPGIYEVTAPGNDYLSAAPQQLRVNGDDMETPQASVQTTGTEKLEKLVLDEVHKFEKACVTAPTNMEEACPYQLQSTDLASFSVKTPAKSVELEGLTQFTASDTTFKYKHNDTEYTKYDEETLEKSFYGEITWDGDKPSVEISGTGW